MVETSSQGSHLPILSALSFITKTAQDLSQFQFTESSTSQSSDLHTLITSAFYNLQKCVGIINARAPVSSLPADVLDLIFREVRHDETQTLRQPLSQIPLINPSQFQCPLSLSHVSRSWYDVMSNSPLLWTTVDILFPWDLSLINLFLARSKSRPIYLNIIDDITSAERWPGYISCWDSDNADQLCDVIVPHIPRCSSVYISSCYCYDKLVAPVLQRGFRNAKASLLQQFFLQVPADHNKHPQPLFTLGAPMLSYVHVNQGAINDWYLPFTSLTSLHLKTDTEVSFSELSTLTSQCPLLQTLAIYDIPSSQPTTLYIPRLRSLQLYCNSDSVAEILLSISAPALESLVIAPFDSVDLQELYFSEVSGPKKFSGITSITLAPYCEDKGLAKKSLRLASKCFPNVVDVTLIGKDLDAGGFINALANTHGDILFPKMQTLALRDIRMPFPAAKKALKTLISRRGSKNSPLQTLYLDKESASCGRWHLKELEVLDKWSVLRKDSIFHDEEDSRFYPY